MIDPRANSIVYQSQGYLVNLVDGLIKNKRLGKAFDKEWDKASTIIDGLEAYSEKDKLADPSSINFVLDCLIKLANLNQYPAAPTFNMANPPSLIVQKGDKGDPGNTGPQGPAGYATDIQTVVTTTSAIDIFSSSLSSAARWDYTVIRQTGEQRSGSLIGTWKADGSAFDINDICTEDIVGSTLEIEFVLQYTAGNIQLTAVVSGGVWSVVLTRYFIPNNGNGTGPISNALPNGQIYIGNALNQAQAQLMSGVINITNSGITAFNPGVIYDAAVNDGAGIQLSKLAILSPDRVVVTDFSGIITTGNPSGQEVEYLTGVSDYLQVQLDSKLTDPTTTVGDIIIRNGSNLISRLGVGTNGQVLTVAGGLPSWQNATNGGVLFTVVEIGAWNMDTTPTVNIPHGLVTSKIRGVISVAIIRDDLSFAYTSPGGISTTSDGLQEIASYIFLGGNYIRLDRKTGSGYDGGNFVSTGINRGWITIAYVP